MDCDFSNDMCSWRSLKEHARDDDVKLLCGRGGNASDCLASTNYITRTWSRLSNGDITEGEITAGKDRKYIKGAWSRF